MAIDFVDEPFTVRIKDGFALLTWPDGSKRGVPLRVFREEHRRASDVLMEYDRGNVLNFPGDKPKRRKAAKKEDGG